MKIALPVKSNTGLQEPIHDHFGSAPYFALYEPMGGTMEFVVNGHAVHEHGNCRPADALDGYNVKTVICRAMGRGAMNNLASKGIRVFLVPGGFDLEQSVAAYRTQSLPEMGAADLCAHHDVQH